MKLFVLEDYRVQLKCENNWPLIAESFIGLHFSTVVFYATASTIDKREVHGDGCVEF